MTTDRDEEVRRVGATVAEAVERAFGTVATVHAALCPELDDAVRAGRPLLDDGVREVLLEPGQLAVGLGLVLAPRPESGLPLRLEWWQVEPGSDRLRRLEPDLKPTSLGYYDYTATEWFDVPRRSGRRHVVGPYVDVHGTGRYVLTLTEPVVAGGEFVGVAGVDVSVHRFERHLLERLGRLPVPFVVLDGEGRVVLSTAARWLVGDLPTGAGVVGPAVPVPGVPWRLLLVDEGSALTA
ncbi:cache domain-containing protein [Trujillonella humicola]|uniref:cache domain-containing protein n=1 Tax=Trujillonella humicola TaxID=3383699 RepID=UPI003906D2B0